MSEKYEQQKVLEQLNKSITAKILSEVAPEEFINFYIHHTQKETMEEYGIRTTKQLTKILTLFNYDFSKPKPSRFKGKKSARTHDSYIAGGQKSAVTQKKNWQAKSEEEKEAWSIKQSLAHLNSPDFKAKITASNKAYRASLTEEERTKQDQMRSQSMKAWWGSLTEQEREDVLANRFKNSQTYHQKNSTPNLEFKKLLEETGLTFEREYCLDKKFFDFKVGNILVEINPTITHNSTFTPFTYNTPLAKNYHKLKSEVAAKYDYRCVHIFDWEDKKKIIRLLANEQQVIYGRNCVVKELPTSISSDFLNTYHLQGAALATFKLGLFYEEQLVSVMTFGKPRYNKNYEYELIRYCSAARVIGGAEKLFSYFITKYQPKSIISYCDLSKFSGETYIKLGFSLLRKSAPSKHWYNIRTKEHYTDALLRKQGFSRLIHHCDAKNDRLETNNNATLMISAGFVEVFDCGQATYIWQVN